MAQKKSRGRRAKTPTIPKSKPVKASPKPIQSINPNRLFSNRPTGKNNSIDAVDQVVARSI